MNILPECIHSGNKQSITKKKWQGFRNTVSQLLQAQKIKNIYILYIRIVKIHNHRIKSNTRQAGQDYDRQT